MSAVNMTDQFRYVVGPNMAKLVMDHYREVDQEHRRIFETVTAEARKSQEEVTYEGLGLAVLKPENAPVAYDAPVEGFRKQFIHQSYALAVSFSEEMIEDSDWIGFVGKAGKQIGKSMRETKQLVCADVLNKATSATQLGADGVPLLADNHKHVNGATWSNLLSNIDLSEAAIETLLKRLKYATDGRGKRANLQAKKIIISPDNEFNLERIMASPLRSGTNNNDVNALKSLGYDLERVVYRYLTNPKFFALQTDKEDGLRLFQRKGLSSKMEGEFETGAMRQKNRERYSVGWLHSQCLYGGEGV